MRRLMIALLVAGTCWLIAMGPASAATPAPPPGLPQPAATCNLLPAPQRAGCISRVNAWLGSCAQMGQFAGQCRGMLLQWVTTNVYNRCRPLPDAQQDACVRTSLGLAAAAPGAISAEERARLNARLAALRGEITRERAEAVGICRRVFDGPAETNCVRGFFPPAPAN